MPSPSWVPCRSSAGLTRSAGPGRAVSASVLRSLRPLRFPPARGRRRLVPLALLALLAVVLLPSRSSRAQYLTVSDLYLSPQATIKLAAYGIPSTVTVSGIVRDPAFATGSPQPLSGNVYLDQSWQVGTRYEYYLVGMGTTYDTATGQNVTAPWQSIPIYVTVAKAPVTANQSVTTRTDPRFSTYTLAKKGAGYQYGTSLYRGGLFAGFNADGANVARTYLKFSSLGTPLSGGAITAGTDGGLWPVGQMELYCTRLARTGSISLLCSPPTSDAWDPTTLVWSNAPAPRSNPLTTTFSWDSANPAGQWVGLNVLPELQAALQTTGSLSEVIFAPSESSGGTSAAFPLTAGSGNWAFFGRDAYQENGQSRGAFLLYAWGGPGLGVSVIFPSDTSQTPPGPPVVQGGSSVTGSVHLTFVSPSAGTTVNLTSSNSSVLSVPATVSVPAGQQDATFTANSTAVSADTAVTVTATYGSSVSGSASITVKP